MPAWIEYPMPTPPPWCSETQLAPHAVLSRALSSGQSAIASEPSFIPSVSRLGDATEPVSRWSRPMTIGARTLPCFTSQLNRSPISARSPYSSQQIRAGRPWNWTRSCACRIQRARLSFSGNVSSTARSVTAMSAGSPDSAAQRNGPAPRQNSGRMNAGHEAGDVERLGHAAVVGDLSPEVVAVVERDRARGP